ncbi:ABC transporter ATP-binding protein [Eubacterium sp.]
MLEVKQVSKKFRKKKVLDSVNINLDKGIYGLLGENGAGKTTLIRCMTGLYKVSDGEIKWDKKNIKDEKEFCDLIGYLPQYFEGLKELTVWENMEYFAHLKDLPNLQVKARIEDSLKKVNLLENKDVKAKNLSGGMKRRLGIAQAILNNPKIIIFDEPTAGLDPKERLRFQNLISDYKNKESITIISTHIVSDIETLCDYIIVMKKGKVLGLYEASELANVAKGKVYSLTEEQYARQKENCYMVSKSQDEDKIKIRVLSEKVIEGKKEMANIEDGYLWLTMDS